ncbi:DUF6807 domain-containing protein [Rhizomonospora bruguierae]|uniref:DUF6807 domain-containing protein n=1 Tax=Rhizomonospora bruguierae TaxID=1581705 RepID=UPI001BD00442|nr:PmoA family protein [Micromonospora sp. NBRC 107566]
MAVTLSVGGRVVAEYVVEPDLDARHGPRPYLHPVRTLAGTPVTDALPEDHVWHLGASLAVQDVSGTNLWGGRTYVRDAGYTWLDDHGRIAHVEWLHREPDRLVHRLHWLDRTGAVLLTEVREVGASESEVGWVLDFAYTLTGPADREIVLGSPATNGRPGGAGYGGFFWRAVADEPPAVRTAGAEGEECVNGSTEPWVLMAGAAGGRPYTLIFSGLGEDDHWFVRSGMYPGVCAAFAFERVRRVPPGGTLAGRHAVLVADGVIDPSH